MNFNLDIHNKIITIIESFNPEILTTANTYFDGGTRITLDFEEYRHKDIYFISPVSPSGYKCLRTVVFNNG